MFTRIHQIKEEYELQEKDKKIILLKKNAEIRKTYNKLLIAITFIILITLLSVYYFFKTKNRILKQNKQLLEQKNKLSKIEIKNKIKENKLLEEAIKKQNKINILQKQQFEKELKHKNRELASITMHILTKNKMLANILNALQNVNITHTENKKQINKIIKKINNKTVKPNELIFLDKLARKYNILTKKQSFSKLSTKEQKKVEFLLDYKIRPINTVIALAQAALESGWGTSRFVKEGNNLFGHVAKNYKKGIKNEKVYIANIGCFNIVWSNKSNRII